MCSYINCGYIRFCRLLFFMRHLVRFYIGRPSQNTPNDGSLIFTAMFSLNKKKSQQITMVKGYLGLFSLLCWSLLEEFDIIIKNKCT
jgi:hypothetical protein